MKEFSLLKKFNWELASQPIVEQCTEQPYRTSIYDVYPFPVTPIMVPTCTKVIDTPAFPTAFAVGSLVGYKIGGAYDLGTANNTFIIQYIGTVETTDASSLFIFPYKTSGSVVTNPSWPGPTPIVSTFANGASVSDSSDNLIPAELMSIAFDQYSASGADMYLIASSSTAVDRINGTAAFEFEFLVPVSTNLKFNLY